MFNYQLFDVSCRGGAVRYGSLRHTDGNTGSNNARAILQAIFMPAKRGSAVSRFILVILFVYLKVRKRVSICLVIERRRVTFLEANRTTRK